MSCDNCTEKESAHQPLGLVKVKLMRGACPMCSAKIECELGQAAHRITYCEICGQKILWKELRDE